MEAPLGEWTRYPVEVVREVVLYDFDNPIGRVNPLEASKGQRLLVEDFLGLRLERQRDLQRFLLRWGPVLQQRTASSPVDRRFVKPPRWGRTRVVPDGPWRDDQRKTRVDTHWWASVNHTFAGFAPATIEYHRVGEESHPQGAPADRDNIFGLRALQWMLRDLDTAIARNPSVAAAAISEQTQWLRLAVEQAPGGGIRLVYRATSLVPYMFLQLAGRLEGAPPWLGSGRTATCRTCGDRFAVGPRRLYCQDACGNAYRVRKSRSRQLAVGR